LPAADTAAATRRKPSRRAKSLKNLAYCIIPANKEAVSVDPQTAVWNGQNPHPAIISPSLLAAPIDLPRHCPPPNPSSTCATAW
jgi:hypothetical protein